MRPTPKSAVVLVPPERLWEPIQVLRRRYDRQVRRWMPHINLLYPFLPAAAAAEVEPRLREILARVAPFELTLARARVFSHGRGRATVWLEPVPLEPLQALYRRLREGFPQCDHLERFPAGFTPHLSIGQAGRTRPLREVLEAVAQLWRPLTFKVEQVQWIVRDDPPADRFRVFRSVRLGRG